MYPEEKIRKHRDFPSFHQQIRTQPTSLPMMTFVEHFASARPCPRQNFDKNIFFIEKNLRTSKLFSTLLSTDKFRKYIRDVLYLVLFKKQALF